jgi:hypothetical protein
MRTSFHHQPEAQHPKSSAIHKLPADYPIFRGQIGKQLLTSRLTGFDPNRTWPISKRREDCKIVLLRTAYQFDILQCTVSVCEGPDEFDQLHRREFIGWVGGATAAWPLAAHAIAGTIAEPPDVQTAECRNWRTSSRNVYALQSLSALMISRVGGF